MVRDYLSMARERNTAIRARKCRGVYDRDISDPSRQLHRKATAGGPRRHSPLSVKGHTPDGVCPCELCYLGPVLCHPRLIAPSQLVAHVPPSRLPLLCQRIVVLEAQRPGKLRRALPCEKDVVRLLHHLSGNKHRVLHPPDPSNRSRCPLIPVNYDRVHLNISGKVGPRSSARVEDGIVFHCNYRLSDCIECRTTRLQHARASQDSVSNSLVELGV